MCWDEIAHIQSTDDKFDESINICCSANLLLV